RWTRRPRDSVAEAERDRRRFPQIEKWIGRRIKADKVSRLAGLMPGARQLMPLASAITAQDQ
ncbi:MAG: hypothetical protein ABL959_09705, partial [Pyrinomonadaceae bacterium]